MTLGLAGSAPLARMSRTTAAWLAFSFTFTLTAARIAAAGDNLLGLPAKAVENEGALLIHGGGPLSDDVFDAFVGLAGGKDARIVLIPTAYPFRDLEHMRNYFSAWFDLEVASFDVLDAHSAEEAKDDEFARPLREATGVWIGGGAQGKLADTYLETEVATAIRGVVERGGVVGGTSAGASFLSKVMIRGGSRSEARVGVGLGLLEKAVVDQHFLQRSRQERLLGVVRDHAGLIGVGVDYRAALVVQGDRMRVLGESSVVVCTGTTKVSEGWIRTLQPGDEAELVAVEADANADDEADTVALVLDGDDR